MPKLNQMQMNLLYFKHIELANEYVASKGGEFYFAVSPIVDKVAGKSANEEYLTEKFAGQKGIDKNEYRVEWLKNNPKHLADVYESVPHYSAEFIRGVFTVYNGLVQPDGVPYMPDIRGEYVNCSGGVRFTPDQPEDYEYTIHLFGHSHVFGYGNEDAATISGWLQKIINNRCKSKVRVVNHGYIGTNISQALIRLQSTDMKSGDKVVFFNLYGRFFGKLYLPTPAIEMYCSQKNIRNISLQHLFDRPHDMGEVFVDHRHIGPKGNRTIAAYLYRLFNDYDEVLSKFENHENCLRLLMDNCKRQSEIKNGLSAFLDALLPHKREGDNFGAIVMNCNPFTLGHKHLIRFAAGQVDHLYVFIVQEDRSEFKFVDRIELVRRGTADIENLSVLPGGEFIISSQTFPEYFDKDVKKDIQIDASGDLSIFSKQICPVLSIKTRFVGEEPFCPITRQYNEQMKTHLERDGISVVEIPRYEIDGLAVSASNVRKLLREGNFEDLQKILPKTTYEFLTKS